MISRQWLRIIVAAGVSAAAGEPVAAGWEGLYVGGQGGLARSKSTWNTDAFLITSADEKVEQDASGWTIGAGVAYSLNQNRSVGLEYDYLRLKMRDRSGNNSGGLYVTAADFKTKIDLLLLRLNYPF